MNRDDHARKSHTAGVAVALLCGLLGGCLDEFETTDAVGLTEGDDVAAGQIEFTNAPPATARAGDVYVYQAEVSGVEADKVSFRIRNRPHWLNWNRSAGRLSGVPTQADLGPWKDLKVLASDGTNEVVAGPFTITVEAATAKDSPTFSDGIDAHPGHYISMRRFDTSAAMIDSIRPGVVGFQKRYYWSQLEPAQDVYNFSAIREDLNLLAGQGMQLVVFLEDKSFNGDMPMPPYLRKNYTIENRAGGYTAKRWSPYVVERFTKLIAELGRAVGNHRAFEGVALQETSLSLNSGVLDRNGYTPEKYRDAIIEVLRGAREGLPQSQIFWYMNFLVGGNGYLADIANVAADLGVAMGGPDVLPDEHALKTHSYPLYPVFRDRMTLFNSMQFNSYSHVHRESGYATKYWTMDELFEFARDELHVDYLFWNRKVKAYPADSYDLKDALATIAANPTVSAD